MSTGDCTQQEEVGPESADQSEVPKQPLSEADAATVMKEPDVATKDFIFQQTMYRIKDPKKSLAFYTGVLGMRLLKRFDFASMEFTVYFLGYENKDDIPSDPREAAKWVFTRKACLELTHNWGSEDDPDMEYHTGNTDPRGYGHIGLSVPNVDEACKRFEELGVEFIKKPSDGKMRGLAFIKDPDGYWIEILSPNLSDSL